MLFFSLSMFVQKVSFFNNEMQRKKYTGIGLMVHKVHT